MKRLNASIAKLDEQLIRMMVIHQLLGTRMSDTLTLERDCLFQIAEQDMISINQPKPHNYIKPISKEVARLIQKAIDYSKQRYEDTKYILENLEGWGGAYEQI